MDLVSFRKTAEGFKALVIHLAHGSMGGGHLCEC